MIRDTYLEVNLDHIAHNVRVLKARVGEDVELCAVLKADAYSTGAVEVAPAIFGNGAYYLAVATLSEALELRESSDSYMILVIGRTPDDALKFAVQNEIALTVMTYEQALLLSELGKKYSKTPVVHIKYNTGMNRLGFDYGDESIEKIEQLCCINGIDVEGIFSHFALNGPEEDRKQYDRLCYAVDQLQKKGILFKFVHMCDGITTILNPEYHLSMVRPGAAIYGIKTYKNADIDIRGVMSMKTKVYQIRKVSKGDTVSYMNMWVAQRDSIIATLPFGYADGLPKGMGNTSSVSIHGKRAPVVGYMCMDQCMVDITDIPDVLVGDDVVIFADGENNSNSISDIARAGGTGQNDVVSRISRRVPRVYIRDGQVVKVVNHLLRREYK
jgi:alanine racemase